MSYAIHRYEPDENGKCTSGWFAGEWGTRWVACNSTQRSSTLHDDPSSDFRERHDHNGGDCMCFEAEDCIGYYGHMDNYILEQERCPNCDRDMEFWVEPESQLTTNLLVCSEHGKMKVMECAYHDH
jgi:hypothetical protein